MRLAHVMAGARHGGAETFFERLCVAQADAGDQVLPVIRHDAERKARLARHGLAPAALRFGQHLDFTTSGRLRRALALHRPDVVVAWMSRAARFAGLARRGADWPLLGRLGGYYDLRHYRGCDHLAGNTRALTGWIAAQGWPADRVHHLPNFVPDLARAVPPPGARHLLAAGRLHRNKGFDVLLRAMPSLPGATLSLAGAGPEEAALRRLAGELGVADRVEFLGWRADIGALLAACDVFVCPSRHEPLGNVVLEAWSAERPVVAAAASGPAELIADGETGALVPPQQPEALAIAIGSLLAAPERAASLAAGGRAAFAREHAVAPVLARWHDVLEQVVASPRRPTACAA